MQFIKAGEPADSNIFNKLDERKRRLLASGREMCIRDRLMCILRCPYRKPTQVDGMSILRPTGEGLLRNSANWPRNFGIRGACESRPQ